MKAKLKKIAEVALSQIEKAQGPEELEDLRIKYLGRKGELTSILKGISSLSKDQRPLIGELANELKQRIREEIQHRLEGFKRSIVRIGAEKIDVSLPAILPPIGSLHPLTQMVDEIVEIFVGLGFRVVEGPEVETDYYNFEALNMPPHHPSRETFHTFYTQDGNLLRSQTSTVQIRVMEKETPPLAVVAPGRVFRPDATDASHSFMFHQVEGLMVDKDISFADLKGVLDLFTKAMFGPDTRTRFRPHFFPFTEPSAEVDISCIICGAALAPESNEQRRPCSVCKGKGWLEILGAGMVDPNVFEMVGYDPARWTGFAFGLGVERIAMLKYGIDDIRLFYENDLRFLEQF